MGKLARNFAYASACFFLISTINEMVFIYNFRNHAMPCGGDRKEYFKAVTSEKDSVTQTHCLEDVWKLRQAAEGFELFRMLVTVFAVLCMIPPVLALAEIGGMAAKGQVMVPAFVTFSVITAMQVTFRAGTITTTNWMANEWNGSLEFLRSLEVAYWVVTASGTWFFALDFIALSSGMISLYYSMGDALAAYNGWCFVCLSMTMGVMGCLHFIAEIARFGNWRAGEAFAFLMAALVGFILMPAWLIMLGRILNKFDEEKVPFLGERAGDDEEDRGVQMTGVGGVV